MDEKMNSEDRTGQESKAQHMDEKMNSEDRTGQERMAQHMDEKMNSQDRTGQERMTDSIGNSADNDSYDNSPHRDVSQKDHGPHSRHKNDSFEIDRNHNLSNNYTATAILEVICCRLNSIVDTIDIFVYII